MFHHKIKMMKNSKRGQESQKLQNGEFQIDVRKTPSLQ